MLVSSSEGLCRLGLVAAILLRALMIFSVSTARAGKSRVLLLSRECRWLELESKSECDSNSLKLRMWAKTLDIRFRR